MKARKAGIILRKDAEAPRRIGKELAAWLGGRGVKAEIDLIRPDQDLLIVLGGDGTLLHVAAEAAGHGIPVLGVNLGGLGFLTEVAADERYPALEKALAGEAMIEERMMIKARLRQDDQVSAWQYALNDVVISKGATARLIDLAVWADGAYIATYRADGLIFSTPTGSTAYNLSAGGPIVQPRLRAVLVTPICPFMLGSRPVLLDGASRLQTCLASGRKEDEPAQVIVDGRPAWEMSPAANLEVVAARHPLRLVCSPSQDYFEILRGKLHWGGCHQEGRPVCPQP